MRGRFRTERRRRRPTLFESSRRRIDPSSGAKARRRRASSDALWRHLLPQGEKGFPANASFLVPLVGDTGLAQIELPLDPAPRLVVQMAVAVGIVDQPALGFD